MYGSTTDIGYIECNQPGTYNIQIKYLGLMTDPFYAQAPNPAHTHTLCLFNATVIAALLVDSRLKLYKIKYICTT